MMKKILLIITIFCFYTKITAQWVQTTLPPNGNIVTNIVDINFPDDTLGFAVYNANNCGLIKTTDGGSNWTCLPQTGGPYKRIQFVDSTSGYAITGTRAVTISTNANSWSTMKFAYLSRPFEIFEDLQFTSSNVGYLASTVAITNYGVVHKTTNSGNTWTTDTLQGVSFVHSLYFQSADTGFVTGVENNQGVIFHTYDAGLTWTRTLFAQIGGILDLHFVNHNVGYGVGFRNGSNEMIKTIDGGQNWTYIVPGGTTGTTTNPRNFRSVFFTHPDTGYAVGAINRAMQTADGGVTWTSMNLTGEFWKVTFPSKDNGFIVGDLGVMLRLNSNPVATRLSDFQINGNSLKIFPNPTKGPTHLQMQNIKQVVIYNSVGQQVYFSASFIKSRELDLTDLKDGFYFVQATDTNGDLSTKKLLLKK
jgi:photosystem II stability/assembly factor-like uncharacterized protein